MKFHLKHLQFFLHVIARYSAHLTCYNHARFNAIMSVANSSQSSDTVKVLSGMHISNVFHKPLTRTKRYPQAVIKGCRDVRLGDCAPNCTEGSNTN